MRQYCWSGESGALPASRNHSCAPIGARNLAFGDKRDEERLACVGRRLSGEPKRFRRGERRIAIALLAKLNAIARKLDVFAGGGRIVECKARPIAALSRGLQPF